MDTPWLHSDSPSLRSTGQNLCHLRTLDQLEPTPPESLLRTLLPEYRARGGVRISPPFAPAVAGFGDYTAGQLPDHALFRLLAAWTCPNPRQPVKRMWHDVATVSASFQVRVNSNRPVQLNAADLFRG